MQQKDNKNNPEELRKIQNQIKLLGNETQKTHETFEVVFRHLNTFVQRKEKLFSQCLNEATDLRYLIIGFQQQVNEYVDKIGKRIRIAIFQKGYKEFTKELDSFGKMFKDNLAALKEGNPCIPNIFLIVILDQVNSSLVT